MINLPFWVAIVIGIMGLINSLALIYCSNKYLQLKKFTKFARSHEFYLGTGDGMPIYRKNEWIGAIFINHHNKKFLDKLVDTTVTEQAFTFYAKKFYYSDVNIEDCRDYLLSFYLYLMKENKIFEKKFNLDRAVYKAYHNQKA